MTQRLKLFKEKLKEDINKDVIKPKINQISLNQKYNNIIGIIN